MVPRLHLTSEQLLQNSWDVREVRYPCMARTSDGESPSITELASDPLMVMASRGPKRQMRWTKDNHLSLDTCWGPRSDLYGWSFLCQWTQYFCSLATNIAPHPPTDTSQSPCLGTGLSGLMSKAVSEWQGCWVPYPVVDPADGPSNSLCWAVSVSSRRTSPNIVWFGGIIGQRHQQVSWLCLLGKTFWSGIQVRGGPAEGLHSLVTLVTLSPVL